MPRSPTAQVWPTDRALVDRCLKGERSAWETLLERYRRLIYSVPVAYGLSPDAAGDIFQRVAVLVIENLHRVRRVESLPAWLLTTSRRECQAFLRGERRWRSMEELDSHDLSEDPPDVTGRLHELECEHALTLAFGRLGSPCRELLTALYFEDPTPGYEEISRRLSRPVGSLGPTRARCLKRLRKLYRALDGPES